MLFLWDEMLQIFLFWHIQQINIDIFTVYLAVNIAVQSSRRWCEGFKMITWTPKWKARGFSYAASVALAWRSYRAANDITGFSFPGAQQTDTPTINLNIIGYDKSLRWSIGACHENNNYVGLPSIWPCQFGLRHWVTLCSTRRGRILSKRWAVVYFGYTNAAGCPRALLYCMSQGQLCGNYRHCICVHVWTLEPTLTLYTYRLILFSTVDSICKHGFISLRRNSTRCSPQAVQYINIAWKKGFQYTGWIYFSPKDSTTKRKATDCICDKLHWFSIKKKYILLVYGEIAAPFFPGNTANRTSMRVATQTLIYLKMCAYVITLKASATLKSPFFLPGGRCRPWDGSSVLLIIPQAQSKLTWSFDALLCNAPVIILSFNKAGKWSQPAPLPSHVLVIYFLIFSQLRNNPSRTRAWKKCGHGSGAL